MSLLTKVLIGIAVFGFVGGMVLAYNHAIAKAEDLQNQLNIQQQNVADLQKAQRQDADALKGLSEVSLAHEAAITNAQQVLAKRSSYIQRTYAGATDAQKTVLDTHLPQFKCVFDRSCETAPAPIVPVGAGGARGQDLPNLNHVRKPFG